MIQSVEELEGCHEHIHTGVTLKQWYRQLMHIVNLILGHETSPDIEISVTSMSGRVERDGEHPHFRAMQSFRYDLQ